MGEGRVRQVGTVSQLTPFAPRLQEQAKPDRWSKLRLRPISGRRPGSGNPHLPIRAVRFMAIYYFNIRNDIDADDPEGTPCTNDAAAREYALEAARDLVCASIHEHGSVNLNHRIEVADESREVLFSVTFRDAFTIEGE